jgi:hypothetical protein
MRPGVPFGLVRSLKKVHLRKRYRRCLDRAPLPRMYRLTRSTFAGGIVVASIVLGFRACTHFDRLHPPSETVKQVPGVSEQVSRSVR